MIVTKMNSGVYDVLMDKDDYIDILFSLHFSDRVLSDDNLYDNDPEITLKRKEMIKKIESLIRRFRY